MAQMLLVAGVLALAVSLVAPRPDIVISSPSYSSSGCDLSGASQRVTATFVLVNRGPADGTVDIHFLVDGREVASTTVAVLAQSSTPGSLTASIPGCASHSYSLRMNYDIMGY